MKLQETQECCEHHFKQSRFNNLANIDAIKTRTKFERNRYTFPGNNENLDEKKLARITSNVIASSICNDTHFSSNRRVHRLM